MDFLALAQDLRRECRIPGTGPTSVVSQTGEALDLVNWIVDEYRSIQQAYAGQWRWLRRPWTFNTVAGTATYAYSAITDTDAAAVISRRGRWLLTEDPATQPTIYLTSDGATARKRLACSTIGTLRARYDLVPPANARPQYIAEDDQGRLTLRATPDDIYTIQGWYMRGPQILAADTDVPEMPEEFHKLIVYGAMIDYAYADVSQETMLRAERRSAAMWGELLQSQLLHKFSEGWDPLA